MQQYIKNPLNYNGYQMPTAISQDKFQQSVQLIEALHGGKIIVHQGDELGYINTRVDPTQSFCWIKKSVSKHNYSVWQYQGRTTTNLAKLSQKDGSRDKALKNYFGNTWNQYAIHTEIPSTMKLLLGNGEWVGTRDDIHLRKDITSLVTDNETIADKSCTILWLFESSFRTALYNFHRYQAHGKNVFSFSDYQFQLGYKKMWFSVFGEFPQMSGKNIWHTWKNIVWWWTGRIEEETKKAISNQGFKCLNVFDIFYSDAPECIIKSAIDQSAMMIKQEFIAEQEAIIRLFNSRYIKCANCNVAVF